MKIINQLIKYGFYLFAFLLPWQTRWIYKEAELNGGTWEYGRMSLYGTEILLIILLSLGLINWFIQYKKKTSEQKLEEVKSELKGQKLLIILLIIWSGLTIFWSANKLISWYSFLKLIEGVGLFWLLNSKLLDLNLKKISLVLIFSAVIQSLFGIGQFLWQWSPSTKWLGLSLQNPAVLGSSVIDNGFGRFLRAYGSLPHPNMLAGFLVIAILLAIIILTNELIKKYYKLLYSAIGILTIGLFLTFSRAGWLVLVISLINYWIYYLIKQKQVGKLFYSTLIIGVIFGILFLFYSDLVKTRLSSDRRLEVKSNQDRMSYYQQAFSIIKDHWLGGAGNGNYTYVFYQKNQTLKAWEYQPVHDAGLLAWAELGIIGLGLFIILIIFTFKNKSRYWLVLLAVIILGFFDHYFRSLYFGIILWWLVLGLMRSEKI